MRVFAPYSVGGVLWVVNHAARLADRRDPLPPHFACGWSECLEDGCVAVAEIGACDRSFDSGIGRSSSCNRSST